MVIHDCARRKHVRAEDILRAIMGQGAHFAHLRGAERAPQKRTSADSAQGARRACHGARANPAPRGARRRRDGCDWRREASRPSQARRSGGVLPLADEGGFAVAEWRRAENRCAPVPTARPTAPAAERSDAKCAGPGSDRTRTQSNDCGAVRAQCGTAHFAREYRWGGGPRTLTGTPHTHASTHVSCHGVCAQPTTTPPESWWVGLTLKGVYGILRACFRRRGGRAWLNAHDSKSCIPTGIGGSNPSLSARKRA